ncbi:MAG: preprotein translocase subunit SecY [Candidatus Sericytochromatia bacterium]|nr:preprotein translocase subunit SecY [Candidatus Sericytochromatia bacterium]
MELWKASGIKQKLLFTLGIIFIFRLGVHIPLGGIDLAVVDKLFSSGNLLNFIDLFSGGALAKFSIFAMGIIPYINASIIMQLMGSVIPKLEELRKEGGESGRRQIAQWTRYFTIILGTIQGGGMAVWLWRSGAALGHPPSAGTPILFLLATTAAMVAGSVFIMWLGEQITERGIGNGASLLIFVGIVARLPSYWSNTSQMVNEGAVSAFNVVLLLMVFFVILVAIIFASEGARKVPVQSAKRQVGRKVYGGRSSYIPFRINQGGVMPIIFASSVLLFPATINQFAKNEYIRMATDALAPSKPLYALLYFLLIIFFSFFYASLVLNPVELAQNLKRYGSYIPGYRPGRPTAEFIEKILTRITAIGAIFLGIIAIVPMIAERLTGVTTLQGMGSTALLIMVGVAIDLYNQLQANLLARQYEGFMK